MPCPGTVSPRGSCACRACGCEQGAPLPHLRCGGPASAGRARPPGTVRDRPRRTCPTRSSCRRPGSRPPGGRRAPPPDAGSARPDPTSPARAVAELPRPGGRGRSVTSRPSRSRRQVRGPAGWPESSTTGIWVRTALRGLEPRRQRRYSPLEPALHRTPHVDHRDRPARAARTPARAPATGLPSRWNHDRRRRPPGHPRTTLRQVGCPSNAVPAPGISHGVDSRQRQPGQEATCRRVSWSTVAGQDQPAGADVGVALVVAVDVGLGRDRAGRALRRSREDERGRDGQRAASRRTAGGGARRDATSDGAAGARAWSAPVDNCLRCSGYRRSLRRTRCSACATNTPTCSSSTRKPSCP